MSLRKMVDKIKSKCSNSSEKATILKIKAEVLTDKDKAELGLKPKGNDQVDYIVRMTNSAGDNWYVAAGEGWSHDDDSGCGQNAYLALFDGEKRQRHAISLEQKPLVFTYYRYGSYSSSSTLRKKAVDYLNDSLEMVSAAKCDNALKTLYKRALYAIDDSISAERESYILKREAEHAKDKEKAERQEMSTRKEVSSFLKSFLDKGRK